MYIGETPYVTKKVHLTFLLCNRHIPLQFPIYEQPLPHHIHHLIPTSNRENSKAKTTGRIWWEGLFVIGGSCLTWGLLRYPEGSKPVSPADCGYTHSSPFNRKTKPVTDMLVWDYKDTKQLTKHQL